MLIMDALNLLQGQQAGAYTDAFLRKFVELGLFGVQNFCFTPLRVTCSLPSILTLTCRAAYRRSVAPCKYVGRFAASSSSRRSRVRLSRVSKRRCFTGF